MSAAGRDWAEEFNSRIGGTMIAAHGTRFIEVSADRAVLELDWRPELTQMTGLFHAGSIISLADEACTALASAHTMGEAGWDPAKFPLTIQLSANLIRNAGSGTLTAEARPLHKGRATVVVQSTVKDGQGRLLATITATQIVPGR
ncbi:MAG TPA: PaaI family thioesterase [Candidatus Methylomirabilis sp.]|nr:PaaI family thioesterase [Candidatus Methylomirabilis sp.]